MCECDDDYLCAFNANVFIRFSLISFICVLLTHTIVYNLLMFFIFLSHLQVNFFDYIIYEEGTRKERKKERKSHRESGTLYNIIHQQQCLCVCINHTIQSGDWVRKKDSVERKKIKFCPWIKNNDVEDWKKSRISSWMLIFAFRCIFAPTSYYFSSIKLISSY